MSFTPSLFIRDEDKYAIVSGHRKRKKRRKISPPLNIQIEVRAYNDVRIFWQPPEQVELFEYRVVRNGIIVSRGLETEYIDTNVNGGNVYTYSVVAVNIFGLLSTPISETLPYTLPPVNNLNATSTYDNVTLSWSGIVDPIFKSYRVLKNLQTVYEGTDTQYTVDGLTPETLYAFTVQVIDIWDNISTNEIELPFTTDVAPSLAPVSGLTFSNVTFSSLQISWNDTPEVTFDKYKLYKNDELIYEGILKSFTVNDLLANTYYVFSIIKIDTWLNESLPEILSGTMPEVSPVTNLVFDDNTLTLSWDNIDGVDGYHVYIDGVYRATRDSTTYTVPGPGGIPFNTNITYGVKCYYTTPEYTPTGPADEIGPTSIIVNLVQSTVFSPLQVFRFGNDGFWFDTSDYSTMWQDINRTVPAVDGSNIALIDSKGGTNGVYAVQSLASKQPLLSGNKLVFDSVQKQTFQIFGLPNLGLTDVTFHCEFEATATRTQYIIDFKNPRSIIGTSVENSSILRFWNNETSYESTSTITPANGNQVIDIRMNNHSANISVDGQNTYIEPFNNIPSISGLNNVWLGSAGGNYEIDGLLQKIVFVTRKTNELYDYY